MLIYCLANIICGPVCLLLNNSPKQIMRGFSSFGVSVPKLEVTQCQTPKERLSQSVTVT